MGSSRSVSASRTVSESFWDFSRQFLSLFGLLADSFRAVLGSSRTVSEPFWASPGQFLSLVGLLPDSFRAFLGSCQTVSEPFWAASFRAAPGLGSSRTVSELFLHLLGLLPDSFLEPFWASGLFLDHFRVVLGFTRPFLSFGLPPIFGLLPDQLFWDFWDSGLPPDHF